MKTIAIQARPAVRISGIILITVAFFVVYNRFLINRSLDNLRYSLTSIQKNEYKGLEKLLSFNLTEEAAMGQVEADILANVEYVTGVVSLAKTGRSLDDAADIIGNVVSSKESGRGVFLNAMDAASNAVTRALGLRAGLAERIAKNGKKAESFLSEKKELHAKLDSAESSEKRQNLLYDIGAAEMKALNYSQAASSFKEAIEADPKSRAAARALFNMAWCEKAMGNIADGVKHFRGLIEQFPDDKLVEGAEFQIAILNRKNFKYQEAADNFVGLADKYQDSILAPLILFQAAATYLYDLDDEVLARQVLDRLRDRYPASEFASTKTFMYKRLYIQDDGSSGIMSRISKLIWDMSPLSAAISEITKASSTKFVIKMIEGAIRQIELLKLDIGDIVKIERTDEFLTNWTNMSLNAVSKDSLIGIKDVVIKYRVGDRIEASGIIRVGKVEFGGYMLGKMELRSYSHQGVRSPQKWLAYTAEICKIGQINVPPETVNNGLVRAHRIFNEKLPFEIKRFLIDNAASTGIWEGPQSVSTSKLQHERPETYEAVYK